MLRRSTLIVLFLFVIVLGIAVYLQRNPLSNADEALPTSTPASDLFALGATSIVSLRVENAAGQYIELAKGEAEGWNIISPVSGLADNSKVDSALLQMSSIKILSHLDPAPALSAMGLENPANKITIGLDDNRTLQLDVGVETPTRSGYYIRLDGGGPVVVPKYSIDTIIGFLENPPISATPVPTETVVLTPDSTSQAPPATATP